MIFKKHDIPSLDFEQMRRAMVEHQLIRRDVKDRAVLDAMRTVPRHLFVPESLMAQAYDDGPLPIEHGQTISQPYVVASMTEHLNISHHSRVLEIGTGCGYQAAVLAEIAREVYTVEIVGKLLTEARKRFEQLHYRNIRTRETDGSLGWPEEAPFDGIIVTAAAPRVPPALMDQIAENGVMVIPMRDLQYDTQVLMKITKTPNGPVRETLYGVRFVPMVGDVERGL